MKTFYFRNKNFSLRFVCGAVFVFVLTVSSAPAAAFALAIFLADGLGFACAIVPACAAAFAEVTVFAFATLLACAADFADECFRQCTLRFLIQKFFITCRISSEAVDGFNDVRIEILRQIRQKLQPDFIPRINRFFISMVNSRR